MKQQPGRLTVIDGLRGIAAFMVMLFHLYNNNPYESLKTSTPDFLDTVILQGWLGVHLFFVLSGFVIAYSLRDKFINASETVRFVVRRSIRLDPPYWFTIALWIGVSFISNIILTEREMMIPGWKWILSHIFYLQHIIGMGSIVPVFWTLCLEVQFYLAYILLLFLICSLFPKQLKTVLPFILFITATGSLFLMNSGVAYSHHYPYGGPWFFEWWHLFCLGALLSTCLIQNKLKIVFYVYLFILVVFTMINPRVEFLMGVATALFLATSILTQNTQRWLRSFPIQFLGKISYSLYLTHFVIGNRLINLLYHYLPDRPIYALCAYLAGIFLSLGVAFTMYWFIEKPSVAWATQFKKK